jgi:hypothetical protein
MRAQLFTRDQLNRPLMTPPGAGKAGWTDPEGFSSHWEGRSTNQMAPRPFAEDQPASGSMQSLL